MNVIIVVVISYILGSIPFGVIAGKIYKIDVTKHGSGNIGFTNVMRVVGIFPAIIVLVLDALKGYAPVYLGYQIGGENLAVLSAIAAMSGHIWPIFLRFKGGRGVATGLGIVIFLSPQTTLIATLIFIVTVYLFRYVSLGSIFAAIFVPVGMFIINEPLPYIVFALLGSLLVIASHRVNIQRLLQGKENKIGNKVINPKGGQPK